MKSTMSAEQARKKVKGQDQMGNGKKGSSKMKSSATKSMKEKSSCCCGY